jgi:hypothetical protein
VNPAQVDRSIGDWPTDFPVTSDGGVREGIVVWSLSGTIEGRTTGSRLPCRWRQCDGWFIGVRWETDQLLYICSKGWRYDARTRTVRVVDGGEISARFVSPAPLGEPPVPREEWPARSALTGKVGAWIPHLGTADRVPTAIDRITPM